MAYSNNGSDWNDSKDVVTNTNVTATDSKAYARIINAANEVVWTSEAVDAIVTKRRLTVP